ncbi:hypothetical protein BC939DRAFT_475137 [Gamsiella multidivaricata]|uniref:uncharacterized protein n=1 Tax=Gamsiella multidivaricata TaxID=101098 RepID=UPI00221F1B86|nr:uncharacterized protein BC939DRAFT_475137 [Gamsiella multidivaricata]KAI7827534.1 hypothetical protein BC939DRAFT_475137 [Gamsiella multidivaricata]
MGAIQSLLPSDSDRASAGAPDSSRGPRSGDQDGLSWASNKMHRDMASKFSEIELLSLRQVFQQLKDRQNNDPETDRSSEPQQHQNKGTVSNVASAKPTKKDIWIVPGITEATFVEYLGIPANRNRAGHLFFRSFYNLSVYPDNPDKLPGQDLPRHLTVRDLIKPLALYCHKINENALLDLKPLRVIFESFAESVVSPTASASTDTAATNADANVTTSAADSPDANTNSTSHLEKILTLERTKTMEDSFKDLTLNNLEWNPNEEDMAEVGPKVKASDLVEILDGLFWLIQQVVEGRESSNEEVGSDPAMDSSHRHRATRMVEHLIQYSKSISSVDIDSELIDFAMFTKYVSRNAPNLFEILSQYFYSMFLIGNTLWRTGPGAAEKMELPGVSPVPILDSPSTILTPDNIALISWFLPLQKTTPTMTNLYTGSRHGFSMNQFEVHICKYPAPTLLLLLVERLKTGTPTANRRQSISFGSVSSRHRPPASSNSPAYNVHWTVDGRQTSFDQLIGRTPTTPASPGSVLSTIFDGVPSGTTVVEPTEIKRSSIEAAPTIVTPRKVKKERLVLGAYVTETWKVSKAGWGNDSFAVFELSPCFEVFPAKKSDASSSGPPSSRIFPPRRDAPRAGDRNEAQNRHFIHFLKNAGVGFGNQASESCLLYMDDNLMYGSYRQDFADGNVYMRAGGPRQTGFDVEFEVVECEVWGLGGPEAKARQKKDWDFEQREANRRASVHLRGKDGEQEIDRDLLVGALSLFLIVVATVVLPCCFH